MRMTLMVLLALPTIALAAPRAARSRAPAKGKAKPRAAKTLYQELGGKAGLARIVDDFVKRCRSDARLHKALASILSNPKRAALLKKSLIEEACHAAGGPCRAPGRNLFLAPGSEKIDESQLEAMIADLRASLHHFRVPSEAQNGLLAKLSLMKDAIAHNAPPAESAPPPASAISAPAVRDMASDPAANASGTPDSPPAPE